MIKLSKIDRETLNKILARDRICVSSYFRDPTVGRPKIKSVRKLEQYGLLKEYGRSELDMPEHGKVTQFYFELAHGITEEYIQELLY